MAVATTHRHRTFQANTLFFASSTLHHDSPSITSITCEAGGGCCGLACGLASEVYFVSPASVAQADGCGALRCRAASPEAIGILSASLSHLGAVDSRTHAIAGPMCARQPAGRCGRADHPYRRGLQRGTQCCFTLRGPRQCRPAHQTYRSGGTREGEGTATPSNGRQCYYAVRGNNNIRNGASTAIQTPHILFHCTCRMIRPSRTAWHPTSDAEDSDVEGNVSHPSSMPASSTSLARRKRRDSDQSLAILACEASSIPQAYRR